MCVMKYRQLWACQICSHQEWIVSFKLLQLSRSDQLNINTDLELDVTEIPVGVIPCISIVLSNKAIIVIVICFWYFFHSCDVFSFLHRLF